MARIFDHILDRIGQMDLNCSSSIDIIGFRKPLKENGTIIMNYEHGNMENINSNNWIWIDFTVAR